MLNSRYRAAWLLIPYLSQFPGIEVDQNYHIVEYSLIFHAK